jgi:large subunit ribosomal protein L21
MGSGRPWILLPGGRHHQIAAGFARPGQQGKTLVYAIIQTRGRQLKVTPGAVVEVDGPPGETGSEFTFDQVLLVEKDAGDILAGAPFVANARVLGVVDGEARGPKLRVFKKKRRKGFRKTRGHRSIFTRVRITDIQV